jgi:DNA-binding HxlR family transcriptional regulator
MSSSVLNQRLHELRDAKIVSFARGRGYSLTEQGHTLLNALTALHAWSQRWDPRGTVRGER